MLGLILHCPDVGFEVFCVAKKILPHTTAWSARINVQKCKNHRFALHCFVFYIVKYSSASHLKNDHMRILHSHQEGKFNTNFQQWPCSAKQRREWLFMWFCTNEHKQVGALANWQQTNKGPDALILLQGWRGTKWVIMYLITVARNWSSVVEDTVIYQYVPPFLGIHINQAKVQQWEKKSNRRTEPDERATGFQDVLFSVLRRCLAKINVFLGKNHHTWVQKLYLDT